MGVELKSVKDFLNEEEILNIVPIKLIHTA